MLATESQTPLVSARSSTDESVRVRRHARAQKRLRLRRLRQLLIALVPLATAALVTFALWPKPIAVDVARVAIGPLVVEVRETGQTRVKDRYVVSAPVTGGLVRLALEVNDAVSEGQALAQIASTPAPLLDPRARNEAEARLAAALSGLGQAEAQVGLARTASELAQTELARSALLDRAGSAPKHELEQAQFAARMRRDELSSAVFARKVAAEHVRLARAALAPRADASQPVEVLSPVSGDVLRVHQESAAVVAAGTPLLEIGDLGALEVVVDLLTTDAVQIEPGTSVAIEGWGGEHALAGRVRKVELAAFTRPSALGVDEQRANTWIVLTEPRERWPKLGDGYRVEVRLVLWQSERVLKAPQGAIFRRGDSWAAFRIDGSTAELVPVKIGHRGEAEVEIVSGLAAGDRLIVDPGDRIDDGVSVRPR